MSGFKQLLFFVILIIAFSGCASTQMKAQNGSMESRVTDLEENSQAKDAEIADLQNQVKDLSSKINAGNLADSGQITPDSQGTTEQAEPINSPSGFGSIGANIIHVKVSHKKIQRALKSAGVYTGPVDGKIGPGTKTAIIRFQRRHGLKSDGILGKETWDILKMYLK